MVIQKTEEYNLPLCLAFVNYEKAFDSIETWAVLQALQRCQVDYQYIEVLKCLYENATITTPIPLQRGVRQGDEISPKLILNWEGQGININGEYFTHLRFADDIVVMAERLWRTSVLCSPTSAVSDRVGLKINIDKIQTVQIGRSNFEKEITRRIRLGWAAFGKLRSVFSSKLSQCLKSKVFD
ncbi:hypothetical protein MSG28_005904 [Choristoneura fumiferana]|uniref:Uncharacterized protein n=1 Tax=Choristoneura fumiferana TaxID=7141 RepID=A0ACC0L1K2_CHOFU|nr:hypothetical protein MSG28_005904 [Choristoneura fumiferana]